MDQHTPRIAATRRHLNWLGVQRPRFGLCLQGFSPLDYAQDPASIERLWSAQLELVAGLGLGIVALPPFIPAASHAIRSLAGEARRREIPAAIPVDARFLAQGETVQELRDIAEWHSGSFVLARLSELSAGARILPEIESAAEELAHDVPIAFASSDILGPGLRTLRHCSAVTRFASGIELSEEPTLAPMSLLGGILCARPEDHPGFVLANTSDPEYLRRILLTAWSADASFALLDLPWQGEVPRRDVFAELRRVHWQARGLSTFQPDHRDARLRVWLRTQELERPGAIDPFLASLALLHRSGLRSDVLVDDFGHGQKSRYALWLPAHGPLDAPAWTSVWHHAFEGATVFITGFEADHLARARLAVLDDEADAERHESPELASQAAPPLETRIQSDDWTRCPLGHGQLLITHRRPEYSPKNQDEIEFVLRAAQAAELPLDRDPDTSAGIVRLARLGKDDAVGIALDSGRLVELD
jgi:hypothetical protein